MMMLFSIMITAQDTIYTYKQVYIKCSYTSVKQAMVKAVSGMPELFPFIWYNKEGQTTIYIVEDNADGTMIDVSNKGTKFTSAMQALSSYTDNGWKVDYTIPLQMTNDYQVYMYLLKKIK